MKSRKILKVIISVAIMVLSASQAWAHCEIPCGIYDDQARIEAISEHTTTIEKSMQQILSISKEKDHNANQLVRWIMNKEDHANQIQEIISQYFMTQRIKPTANQYVEKLTILHKMLISAMKCKQTTDQTNIESLRKLTDEFKTLYFAAAK